MHSGALLRAVHNDQMEADEVPVEFDWGNGVQLTVYIHRGKKHLGLTYK